MVWYGEDVVGFFKKKVPSLHPRIDKEYALIPPLIQRSFELIKLLADIYPDAEKYNEMTEEFARIQKKIKNACLLVFDVKEKNMPGLKDEIRKFHMEAHMRFLSNIDHLVLLLESKRISSAVDYQKYWVSNWCMHRLFRDVEDFAGVDFK